MFLTSFPKRHGLSSRKLATKEILRISVWYDKKNEWHKAVADFDQGLIVYAKSSPAATFVDIEKKMREENFNIYMIALVGLP